MKKGKWLVAILSLLLLVACQSKTETKIDKVSVVTTFYPVYYMTKAIAGDAANVSMLVDSNVEPHDFEPSAKDIAKISDAKVFVYSNVSMETWVDKVEKSVDKQKVTFVEAGEDVTFIKGSAHHHDGQADEHEEDEQALDPHIWLDPVNAQAQVKTIAAALIKVDSANKATYEANRDALLAKLTTIATKYADAFKDAKNKVFATQHAAFGYIAHRYQLEQVAISGLESKEPSAKDLAEIEEEIKEHQLKAIYVDPTSSHASAETVAKETGVLIERLYTLESQPEGMDYLQTLEANLVALQKTIQ